MNKYVVNNKLFYTVESILAELASIICHSKEVPPEMEEFYKELKDLSNDLTAALEQTKLTANEATEEISNLYCEVLNIYVNQLETEANLVN
jgi:uncharacterized membrane protein YgaE (UPF0421/DUF939 family)